MEVHRNLRTPKAGPGRLRMVRIVGDGTPPNTRILDGRGEPLEELVTSYSVQGDGKGCARGAFIFLETDEDGQVVIDPETNAPLEGTFEAWVVYEQPPERVTGETPALQVARLAQHILDHVPDEPSMSEGAVDTAIRLLRELVEVPEEGERFWMCKIGPVPRGVAPRVALDHPMRTAVEGAFRFLFGVDAEVDFSGWGAHLTALEREVLEEDRSHLEDGRDAVERADAELEDGGIGVPDGPVLDRAADAPPECFAEPRGSDTVNDPDHPPTEPSGLDVGLIGRGGDGPERFIPAPNALEVGDIGIPSDQSDVDRAAPRDGGTKEGAVPAESDEKAFARLAPGPGHGGGSVAPGKLGNRI